MVAVDLKGEGSRFHEQLRSRLRTVPPAISDTVPFPSLTPKGGDIYIVKRIATCNSGWARGHPTSEQSLEREGWEKSR
jgi:hypothetical protein